MRKMVCVVALVFVAMGVGCEEVRKSDAPLVREKAIQKMEWPFEFPLDAKNIRFFVSGGTQNWTVYLSYEASYDEIKISIQRELFKTAAPEKGLPAENYRELPLPKEEPWWLKVLSGYPSWWKPEDIKEGFFVCSPSGGEDGPKWWVDTRNGRVYYYTHSN